MKKILVILLVAMFLTPVAAMAYTGEVELGTPAEVISVLSNNVTLEHSGNGTSYAAVTGHLNGSKVYGSSSGDTKLFSQSATAPITVPAPGASDSSAFTDASTWKPL